MPIARSHAPKRSATAPWTGAGSLPAVGCSGLHYHLRGSPGVVRRVKLRLARASWSRTLALPLVAVAWVVVAAGGQSRASASTPGGPDAVVSSVSASPADLGASGGTVALSGRVANAKTCQLKLLSNQSFPVVYSHNPKACSTGSYSAQVTIGPNPTAVQRTVAFALVARNRASASAGRLYILLAGAHRLPASPPSPPSSMSPASTTTPPTTVPPTATVPSTTATSISLTGDQSANWSGYVAGGGPYSVVKGSFTVPSPVSGTPSDGQVSEWVGVDGASSIDTSLIQAGVAESADPQSPGGVSIQPWWEILPAAETNISTLPVSVGDRVTVTIWRLGGTSWEINLTDDTNGQSYTTPPEQFTGAGSSAEWIVEAPAQCLAQDQCQLTPLAPYSPDVAFRDLGMSGAETSLDQVTMVQGGESVSTPSGLSSGQFSVRYTGTELSDRAPTPAVAPSTATRSRLATLVGSARA